MFVLVPFIFLWYCAALVLRKLATVHQPCHRRSKRTVPEKLVQEVHGRDGGVRSGSPRIGTLVHSTERVPRVNTLLGCQAGSLVWLMLDANSFAEVIVRKTVFDKSGDVLKYNVWLDSNCLVEADEDQVVQPFNVGAHVKVTALGEVRTARLFCAFRLFLQNVCLCHCSSDHTGLSLRLRCRIHVGAAVPNSYLAQSTA